MKDKIKTIVNSNLFNYLFNVLLVIAIFIAVLVIKDVAPFGNNLLGKNDAFVQFKPMLYDFIMGLKTGTLEAYSFNNALGNSYMFNFVYYLISPFNLIAMLFKDADMMFLSVVLIKMMVASLAMTFYAKKKGASNFVTTIATIGYIFSGWFLAYWYNIMWLDTFALFPLFQYALDKLLKENKCLLYIFVLAFIYVTNFYQAFSILVYNIVYFIIYNFFYKKEPIKEKIKTCILFLGSTFISVMLIYVYIYTLVLVKKQMGMGFSDVSESGYIISSIDFIKTIFYGAVKVTTEKSGTTFPNLCVNTMVLVGAISFFFNNKKSVRDRVFSFIGLSLMICCIFFKEVDYVMHMFHNVIGLTFRYSYIMSFLMIAIFIKNANKFEMNKKKVLIILVILLAILGICYKHIEFDIFIFNVVSLLICGILTLFYSKNNVYNLIVLIVIIVQSLVIGTYNFTVEGTKDAEGLKNNYSKEKFEYRVLSVSGNDYLNQNLYYNKNVLYQYTSMTYNDVLGMVRSLGCSSGPNVMSCNDNDKIVNMIFNVKNDYYLERVFSVNENIFSLILNEDNVKGSQEQLIEKMTGITEIFDKEELVGIVENDKITFKTDKEYYLVDYINTDGSINNYSQSYNEFYLDKNLDINEVNIYTINEEKLKEVYEILSKNQMKYSYFSDSLMEGEIEVGENQLIFTSIPYDEAWHVYIDDKEVETTKVLDDALLAIKCETGKHKIKLEYKIDYKKPLFISISIFIILVVYAFYMNFKIKCKE